MLDSPRTQRYQSAVLLGPRLVAPRPEMRLEGARVGCPNFTAPVFVGGAWGKRASRQREGNADPPRFARLLMQPQGSQQVSPQIALNGADAAVCLAGVAQLVEHLFCKQVVRGSSPLASSSFVTA